MAMPSLLRCSLLSGLLAIGGAARASGPVLVELFTSEGCSSCPAADALLLELDGRAEVIALGEHVDYWDRLGWADPYGAAAFSRRQEAYARRFGLRGVYTPQMVVDGQRELVGSDRSAVQDALAQARDRPKLPVNLRVAAATPASVPLDVTITPPGPVEPSVVILALVEGPLETRVTRGENAGRVLRHAAVVRTWTELGQLKADGSAFHAAPAVPLERAWAAGRLKAVVFVQGRESGRILGAASVRVGIAQDPT